MTLLWILTIKCPNFGGQCAAPACGSWWRCDDENGVCSLFDEMLAEKQRREQEQ